MHKGPAKHKRAQGPKGDHLAATHEKETQPMSNDTLAIWGDILSTNQTKAQRFMGPLEGLNCLKIGRASCWRKNQYTGIRGQVFSKLQKVNQACQSIWHEIDKGENKIKFESVSAGIPNITHTGVSASSTDTVDDKKNLNASV
jgi:hypothetical protein